MKNKKFISGKASLVILLTVFVISFALLLNSISKVSASVTYHSPSPTPTHNNHDDHDNNDHNDNHDHDNDCKDKDGHYDQKDCKDHSPSPTPDPCKEDNKFGFFGDHNRKDCATPTPAPTATPGDVCWNLDGFQGSIPDGYHKDSPDGACNQFQMGGAPPPPSTGGSSGTGGQVLGASTMAGTGGFEEMAYQAIMILGGTLSAFGIKGFKKASKKA